MKAKLKLVLPSREYANSFLRGYKEYLTEKNQIANTGTVIFEKLKDFPVFNKRVIQNRKGVNLPKGRVPATLYWAVVGDKFVGRVDIRHYLNKHLRAVGGHIGYSVVPSQRRKGYATEMLRLGLQKSKKLGIKKVLITCLKDNIASKKVIEKNGGIFENEVIEDKGLPLLRYWIKI